MMAALIAAATLGELLGVASGGLSAVEVSALTLDSRKVANGTVFVALPGTQAHGLHYAADALNRGASAVLFDPAEASALPESAAVEAARLLPVEGLGSRLGAMARAFFWRDRRPPDLFGVTGTNGKTTVAWLVAQAMNGLGRDCGYVGTLGFGRPGALQRHELTTPDCFSLHQELAEINAKFAAIEVSSHGLAQDRLAGLDFSIAAVTNLTRDHLDAHGSFERYAAAKARILKLPGLAAAVLNVDDEFAAGLVERLPAHVRSVRVARRASADIEASVTRRGFGGQVLDLRIGGDVLRIESDLVGDFNAENLIVALGVLMAAGIEPSVACGALSACRPAPGRLEVFRRDDGLTVIVDYAHTPDALERTVAALREVSQAGDLAVVFGCGGERDAGKRPLMGQAVARASRVVLTDDNPRGESPERIVADIERGLPEGLPYQIEHDRETAIATAISAGKAGDVVLIAGKGHEDTQDIAGHRRVLDDRAVVQAALGVAG